MTNLVVSCPYRFAFLIFEAMTMIVRVSIVGMQRYTCLQIYAMEALPAGRR